MWTKLKRKFGFSRPATTPIDRLRPGMEVTIEGQAFGLAGPVTAPFSGAPCATLTVVKEQTTVEHGTLADRGSRETNRIADCDFGQRFVVNDGTGSVVVDRMGWSSLEVRLVPGRNFRGAAQAMESFAAKMADNEAFREIERVGFVLDEQDASLFEAIVPEGTRVRVRGVVEQASAELRGHLSSGEAGFRGSANAPLALVPGDKKLSIQVID